MEVTPETRYAWQPLSHGFLSSRAVKSTQDEPALYCPICGRQESRSLTVSSKPLTTLEWVIRTVLLLKQALLCA
jgi:hypothetical protein